VAVIVTGVEADTAEVEIVKLAVVPPDATVTEAGTEAALELLPESVTTAPPAGAALDNTTVPRELLLPCTLVGFSARELSVAPESAGLGLSTVNSANDVQGFPFASVKARSLT
jgi:hypothetical protein